MDAIKNHSITRSSSWKNNVTYPEPAEIETAADLLQNAFLTCMVVCAPKREEEEDIFFT